MIDQFWIFHCGYIYVPEILTLGDGMPMLRCLPFMGAMALHRELGPILIDAPFGHEGPHNVGSVLGTFLTTVGTQFKESWSIIPRIEQLGRRPSQVNHVLMTHLHFDHTGGMKELSHATFHVNRTEWNFANSLPAFDALKNGYILSDYRALHAKTELMELPRYFERDDEGFDVFGDGSIFAHSLPGHSPGHTGYRVRLSEGREIFYLGDAIFHLGQLEGRKLGVFPLTVGYQRPDVEFTAEELVRYAKLHPETTYVCSHDFDLGERCLNGPVALHNDH